MVEHPNAQGSVSRFPGDFSVNTDKAISLTPIFMDFRKAWTKKLGLFLWSCIVIINFSVCFGQNGYARAEAVDRSRVFSIEFKDEPITDCLERLSLVSGYDIRISGDYSSFNIIMKLKNVTLEKAFEKILKGIDYAVKWNGETQKVTLFLYARSKMDNQKATPPKFTPPFPVTPLHSKKPDEMQKRLKDNAIDERRLKEPNRSGEDDLPVKRERDGVWKRKDIPLSGSETNFIQGTQTGRYD